MKSCSKCATLKVSTEFHKRARSNDGLMSQCKECVNSRIRANYAKDPEPKIRKTRQYHREHPEWSQQVLRDWHAANRDRRAEKVKNRIKSDPEFATYRRKLTSLRERERRAEKVGTELTKTSQEDYDRILEEHDGRCWICELPVERVFWDHVQPLSKGGPHVVTNLRPACNPCNSRKSNLWPFTDAMKTRIATEVRALHASQSHADSVTDGLGVLDVCL